MPYHSNFAPAAFEAAVEKCKEYIKAGDIFQVVLSQRLQTETPARPFDIYRTLRVVNPEPVHVLSEAGAAVPGRQLAGDHGARRGRQGDDPPAGRHAPPRPHRGGRRTPGRRAARRSQGARRAHHARRPGPQRRRPGRSLRHRAAERRDDGGALQPRHAPVQHRDRPAATGQDGLRRPAFLPAGRHA